MGILIGLLAGVANFAFVEAYRFLYSNVVTPYWGSPLVIIPVLCGGLVLFLLSFIFPNDVLGYGFPKFLEKINLRGGILKPRETIAKTLGSCVTLGFGDQQGRKVQLHS